MAEKKVYECRNCGNKLEVDSADSDAPECCEAPMEEAEPLPVCDLSTTAEHSRFDDMGEPCDDGRAGK